jgi:hypothetical protein
MWWPRNRQLGDQLPELFDLWPSEQGGIGRILYSRPDWDDSPQFIRVHGRQVKADSVPHDKTHELTLILADGTPRTIKVIRPSMSPGEAVRMLDALSDCDRSGA